MKAKLRNTIIFTVIGLIAGFITVAYQVNFLSPENLEMLLEQAGSVTVLYIVTSIQVGIYAGLSSFIGQFLIEKVSFKLFPSWNTLAFIKAIIIGLFSGAFIVLMDVYVFSEFLPSAEGEYQINVLYLFSGLLYGGIVEELMIRLFLLTFTVVILNKVSKLKSDVITWIAIIITSVIFAAGHLPAAILTLGSDFVIIIRVMILNFIPGILFGYIYTKHGLLYSMSAHMFSHVFMQLVFLPLFV
ncbi:type II CAAX prenyl endopeptidase Rce1 family protein [Candidatus Izemoplasma sp. B36]|uniref:CPBP family glutamic-type intramembrane protease n=1 Tax=Candidatus Izemoplasma sp. B36 TaxID=3242468 RepID=UPI0035592889